MMKLPNLEYLHLSNNEISGSLTDIEKSFSLMSLHIDNNYFTGTLPASLPPTLINAWLNNNSFKGEIPSCYGADSPDLYSVRLHGNSDLYGTLYCPDNSSDIAICDGVAKDTILASMQYSNTSGDVSSLYTADCANVSCSCCECY